MKNTMVALAIEHSKLLSEANLLAIDASVLYRQFSFVKLHRPAWKVVVL
jgi:hypothetical protein